MKKSDHILIGGDDFTEVCSQLIRQQFWDDCSFEGVAESIREKMNKQIQIAGEKVKVDLSMKDVDETAVEIDNLISVDNDSCVIEVREQDFVKASSTLFEQLKDFIHRVLLDWKSISVCEISGGGMRMHQICDLIELELRANTSCQISFVVFDGCFLIPTILVEL